MAKMTSEMLVWLKKAFDDKEFLIIDGVMYRKIISKGVVVKDEKGNSKVIPVKKLLKVSCYDNKYNIVDKNIYKNFKKMIETGDYHLEIIDMYERYLYKKVGSTHERGYIKFETVINGITYRTFVHRIVYYITYGEWDDNKVIHHKDNNKKNNRPENLQLITQFENVLLSIRNDEILMHPSMLDDITKSKYHLDAEKWELFKDEVLKAHKRHGEKFQYPMMKVEVIINK